MADCGVADDPAVVVECGEGAGCREEGAAGGVGEFGAATPAVVGRTSLLRPGPDPVDSGVIPVTRYQGEWLGYS